MRVLLEPFFLQRSSSSRYDQVFQRCNDPRFYQILGEFFCFYFACADWKFTRF
jgi:hypothetical protein